MEQQFGSINLGHRSGASQGKLRVSAAGIVWRAERGGKTVDAPAKDIASMTWCLTSRGCQLTVRKREKQGTSTLLHFSGFREKARPPLLQDLDNLKEGSKDYPTQIQVEELAVGGHNWGQAEVEEGLLTFRTGGRPVFRIPLRDVGQVQQNGRDEILLDFPVDDAAGGEREDALVELSLALPKGAGAGIDDEEGQTLAQALSSKLRQWTDAGATGDAVTALEGVNVVAPRGRFDLELYLGFLKLLGQAQDFRIQYDALTRVFLLPKPGTPLTLVALSLDPPIRKGNTYYPHLLLQFHTDEELEMELAISPEALAAKNEKCGGKLQTSMRGPGPETFARVLRGLSGARLTKPGSFRSEEDGHALRCSYKADDGYLFPLERAFFYVHKPPLVIVHDEVECVEFMRQGGGVLAASAKTFDLAVRLKNDQEYLFRNIQKSEWTNLFAFIQAKQIRLANFQVAKEGPAGPNVPAPMDLGEDIDTGLARLQAHEEANSASEDEESDDADFNVQRQIAREDNLEPEDGEEEAETKTKKAKAAPKAKADKPETKKRASKKAEGEKPAKKPRAKKDPDAPKKNMTGFMLFSQAKRDEVKADNPGIAFADVGRELGKMWKEASDSEKGKYNDMSAKDKLRYEKEKAAYDKKKSAAGPDDEEEDEEEEKPAPKPKAAPKKAAPKAKAKKDEDDDDEEEEEAAIEEEEEEEEEDDE